MKWSNIGKRRTPPLKKEPGHLANESNTDPSETPAEQVWGELFALYLKLRELSGDETLANDEEARVLGGLEFLEREIPKLRQRMSERMGKVVDFSHVQ